MIKEKPNPKSKDDTDKFIGLVPGIKEMTILIEGAVKEECYSKAIKKIKDEILKEDKIFNIESLLSNIAIKEQGVGQGKLCNLDKTELKKLKKLIEEEIKKIVSVHEEIGFEDWITTHDNFVKWINVATRKNCVEIFTTNYDYIFECAFEKNNYPYFDGFVGSYKPFFLAAALEDDKLLNGWTKLWKIHGSLGLMYDEKTKKVIRCEKNSDSIIIYPSVLKYDNSRKQPYASFLDRLGRFICKEDTVLVVCGYSMSDDHINEIILNSLNKSQNSSALVLLYDDFDISADIAKLAMNEPRISIYGRRNAVIGGNYGNWMLKNQPSIEDDIQISSYFLQDAPLPTADKGQDDEINNMGGEFLLIDFTKFVSFLNELNYTSYKSNIK